jgi:hypothetical protein
VVERLEPQILLRPADVPLIPQVSGLQPKRHPTKARLREENLERRKALEHASEDQLADTYRWR